MDLTDGIKNAIEEKLERLDFLPARNAAVFNGDTTTGIDGVNAEAAQGAAEIYTLSGVRVIGEPAPGIYIVRQGDKAVKTVIR